VREERPKGQCPCCKIDGEPTAAGPLRSLNGGIGAYEWRCSKCGMEWDINEDFNCIICGVEVPGRYICCSTECSEKFDKL
jgi:hypothetical protein